MNATRWFTLATAAFVAASSPAWSQGTLDPELERLWLAEWRQGR